MSTAAHIVTVYRIDTGARVEHLTRAYRTASEATTAALEINCKAFSPFFATAAA